MKFTNSIFITLFCFAIFSCSIHEKKSDYEVYKHSHNDYEHENPLFDALNENFRSVEADIYSIGDSLFVAHDFDKIRPGQTLRSLYLEPLKNKIAKNAGSVYGNGDEIILFVDIKDDGLETYKLLHKILQDYKSDLSVFENGIKTTKSILVVVSGNRPFEFMEQQTTRFAGFDGRFENLDTEILSQLMPVVSDNWNKYFKWDGIGEIPESEEKLLCSFVEKAHQKGCLIRFWATPSKTSEQQQAVWTELAKAKVDLIGTDNLQELNDFVSKLENN